MSAADRPSRFPWPPVLLLAALASAWALGRPGAWPLPWPGMDDRPAHIVGYGLGFAGLALALWALFTFVEARTQIRPDQQATRLVTHGPYRRWRNPMYLGEVLIMLGLAELTHNVWFAILAPVFAGLVTWLAVLPEERHLEARFGADYLAYKERSRRWI